MQHSENFNEIATALSSAVAEFPTIKKEREVSIDTRTGGAYKYKYATLDSILAAVRGPLCKHGIVIIQSQIIVNLPNNATEDQLETRLIHTSGQWISNSVPIIMPQSNVSPKEYGTGTTYARRYGLSQLICIAAEDDDDAESMNNTAADRSFNSGQRGSMTGKTLTEKQATLLASRLFDIGGSAEALSEIYNVSEIHEIPFSKMNEALDLVSKRDARLFTGAPVNGDEKARHKLAAFQDAFNRNMLDMNVIRYHLGIELTEESNEAAEIREVIKPDPLMAAKIYMNFSDKDKTALYLAASKGGFFTTAERKQFDNACSIYAEQQRKAHQASKAQGN